MTQQTIRLGTRSSPLALVQANMVKTLLEKEHQGLDVEIVPIRSAADWKKQDGEKALNVQAGGKGLFAKEIEEQILAGDIDVGVHSAKDMPSFLPEGLIISHYLPRADARDAFISHKYKSIEDLPEGATIGTCSPRRQSMALSLRPDLKIVPFRGNVQTRLDKVREGQVDATFLAMAGLNRLGIEDDMIQPLLVEDMLPAAGQGAICIESRADDKDIQSLLDPISCTRTYLNVSAEREVLKILDGSCHTPIGAYADYDGKEMSLSAYVGSLDGKIQFQETLKVSVASIADAENLGQEVGQKLRDIAPENIL